MAIQIKRSAVTPTPISLANGEIAFSGASNVFFIGFKDVVIPIAGKRTPGLLSPNQAIVTDSSNYINQIFVRDQIVIGSNNVLTINSSSFSGTANNANYLSNVSLVTIRSEITSNTQAAYTNAVSYVNSKVYANTAQLNANITLVQSQLVANSATAYNNAVAYVDSKVYANTSQLAANITLVQSQLVANSATAYSNAVAYVDGKVFANTSQVVANAQAAYSNAVAYIDGKQYVNTSQLSSNLLNYALLSGSTFTGPVVIQSDLAVTGNLIFSGNTVIIGANNLAVNDAVISIHTPANGTPWSFNDGKNIGVSFHYYDTSDNHALLVRENSTGRLTWYTTSTDPSLGNVYGNTLGDIQARSFWAGNSTVYSIVNATSFSGTSNNAVNLDGLSLATIQGQITSNAQTAYTNSIAYVDGKVYANTSQLAANIALVQSQLVANSQTAYSNAVTYVDGKVYANTSQLQANIALVQSQIVANSATAYSNAVAYVDGKVYANTSQLAANIALVQSQIVANSATTYSNATVFASNANNITSGTLGYNIIPANVVNTTNHFTITGIHTHNANLVIGNTSAIVANGSPGTDGQLLVSNGTTVYWASVGFANGQSISVNNFAITGTFTANSSVGGAGQVLTSNGAGVYWSNAEILLSTGNGLTGGPITSIGTISVLPNTGIIANTTGLFVDPSYIQTISANSAQFLGNSSGTLSNITTWIVSNSAAAYTNAVAYVDGKVYANTAQLAANIALVQSQLVANSQTAYTNAIAYVDGKVYANTSELAANVALVQSQLVANSATAYSNAVAYVDSKSYVNTAQLSGNLALYAPLAGAYFTGDVVIANNLTVSGNLVLTGNTVVIGANNLIVNDAVISLHSLANGAPWTVNDGKNIGIAFHYYDTQDEHGLLIRENSTGHLVWYSAGTSPDTANPVGEVYGIIQTGSYIAGNSTVYSTINASSFSGTANNSTHFNGLTLATVQNYITSNSATAYTNAVAYVDGKVYANTAELAANIALVQSQIVANAATTYSNATIFASNATNITTGTLNYGLFPANIVNTTGSFTITGVHNHTANVLLGQFAAVSANGSFGSNGQFLTSNGSAVYWRTPTSAGATYTYVGANTTLDVLSKYIVDTTSGNVDITLPGSPTTGDWVIIADGGGDKYTNPAIILRNGLLINGANSNLELDVPDFKVEMIYTGTTWKVFT